MVRQMQRRYRKASDIRGGSASDIRGGSAWDERCYEMASARSSYSRDATDNRKTYAGKVRSLIEKKHRRHRTVVGRLRNSIALRGVLAGYPRNSPRYRDAADGSISSGCDSNTSELLEEVYESQKLNFRRMISNMSRGMYEARSQWDADSWTDLESNFSLIYEPAYVGSGRSSRFYSLDDDDVTLTLEKVKNMKNSVARNNNNNNNDSILHPLWDCCFCDYCEPLTPDYSDSESFLSSCSSCLRNCYNQAEMRMNGKAYRDVTPRLSRRDSWTNSDTSDTYEPVSADHVVWSSRIKKLKKKLRSSAAEARLDGWSDYQRFTPTPLAIDSKEKKMKELIEKLKEDLDSDWDSNASVSLGLIYIPMEEPKNNKTDQVISAPQLPKTVSSLPVSSNVLAAKEAEIEQVGDDESTDDDEETLSGGQIDVDPLGSLESLIFEPKDAEEIDFPKAIGRNSRLKASISVSNVTNSNSLESLSTIVDKTDESSDVKESVVLGDYWDWSAGNKQKVDESISSPCSECKTCAGETSVVSWTYIGRQNNLITSNNTSKSVSVRVDTPKEVPKEIPKKKEVTWKIIGERRKAAAALNEPTPSEVVLPPVLDEAQLIGIYNSWSDLESMIFPEEANTLSAKGTLSLPWCNACQPSAGPKTSNRMNCYRDDWMWWDQQRKARHTVDRKRKDATWRTKAKRMFLWMHLSQESPGCLAIDRWTWWKAKQRVSILWLISKANNNKVPDDLKEPYYKDHDDQDQLKPVIVHALATAEYYCLALGNIYADPNYHNLNHWGVIQALARKGVYVAEPSDVALTETVLIQTSPIRMSAHMAVIEAIMALYLKETITVERIVQAVRRFIPAGGPIELPADIEDALVFWINKVCVRMKHRIEDEMGIASSEVQKSENEIKSESEGEPAKPVDAGDKSANVADKVSPPLNLLQDLSDLNDGCCLAALISYYCPTVLRWQAICLNSPMSMADSLYNLQLVQKFCREHLPYDPCFLTLEDMVYQHSSVTQNILVFLAELFYVFEIRPANCVYNPLKQAASLNEVRAAGLPNRNGHSEGGLVSNATKRSFQQPVSPIPDLRTSCSSSYYTSVPDLNRISPKGNGPFIREPLLPRRQHSQHERMQERNKRFSFNDGPKGVNAVTPVNSVSMRRSHSVQDMDKNGAMDPVQNYAENEAESAYYSTSPVARKQMDDQVAYESTSELYLRPLPSGENEHLMPAVIKPHKERNNRETKPEELGEYPVNNTGKVMNHREAGLKDNGYHVNRQSSPDYHVNRQSSPEYHVNRQSSPDYHINRQSSPDKYLSYNLKNANQQESDLSTYLEIKPDIRYDYPDNRQLEESLTKQPYILSSNENLPVKEALESLGSSESGVFLDHLPKKDLSTTSFAQLSKLRDNHKGINIVYMQHDRDGVSGSGGGGGKYPTKSSFLQKDKSEVSARGDRKTSFADLPNQTTWLQHQVNNSSQEQTSVAFQEPPLVSQLVDVRLKLEEKRRNIEAEKRKMDAMVGQARQQMGKTAFLQVVSRGKSSGQEEHEGDHMEESLELSRCSGGGSESERHVDNKELNSRQSAVVDKKVGEYNRSIEQLTSSLSGLQSDIQRLSLQQEKIQNLVHNGMSQVAEPQNQFYLHDQLQPVMQPMWSNRSPPQEFGYGPPPTMPRSQSREQLYQPLQRTQSREQLMGTMVNQSVPHQMGHWGNESMLPQPYPVSHVYAQQPYMEQSGFNLHSQPHFIPMYPNNSMMTTADSYGANYGTYQQMPVMSLDGHQRPCPSSSSQIHVDVSNMSAGPTSSHSQSPMTYHRSPQPPRPPSRPSSAPANTGPGANGPCLPMKSTPVMAPLEVCMEPQSVHFLDLSDSVDDHVIANQEVENVMSMGGPSGMDNMMSGTATYRVREPLSPTRPVLGKTFRVPKAKLHSPPPKEVRTISAVTANAKPTESDAAVDKGFFVPFDGDSQPRKPKPLINSAKKVPKVIQKTDSRVNEVSSSIAPSSPVHRFSKSSPPSAFGRPSFEAKPAEAPVESYVDQDIQDMEESFRTVIGEAERNVTPSKYDSAVGFVIGENSKDADETLSEDEMARRKERILLSVIKRKEQQEALRARKELEAAKRREKERIKQETIERKKEEDRLKRQAILEQYKQRKAAMEEQEGDRDNSRTATLPKSKIKPGLKPRPKSLHESAMSGHDERQPDRLTRATGGRGSQSNIANREGSSGFKYMETDASLGRATPPRRAPSPGQNPYDRHPPSPISYQYPPGGLPPGLVSRRPAVGSGTAFYNDTASDSCSTASSTAVEYTGPKLFKQPTAKSNRGIVINAINTVLAGAVNGEIKRNVLEEIGLSESKHFLILFRDAGCQFRGIYSYSPEKEEILKLYGTGPRQVGERMMDKFFKYNCGGRNFTEIQTKHLTVTIDAFTIHNSLWQGKKAVQGRKEL